MKNLSATPWRINAVDLKRKKNLVGLVDANGVSVAERVAREDADVMAAAPELLEALKAVWEAFPSGVPYTPAQREAFKKAFSALRSAGMEVL